MRLSSSRAGVVALYLFAVACGGVTDPPFPLTIGDACAANQVDSGTWADGKWSLRYYVTKRTTRQVARPDGVVVQQTVLSCVTVNCTLPDPSHVRTESQAIEQGRSVCTSGV